MELRPEDRIVAAQAVAAAALAWPGRRRWSLPGWVTGLAALATTGGGLLALASVAPHGGRLTPRVEPPADATLLTSGPYRVSRHPIYAALLVSTAGVAVLRRRPEPLLAWLALAAVLTAKTAREEVRLEVRFGEEYRRYRARTPRFLGRPRRD